MGQAKRRGSFEERTAAAEGRPAKPTKEELRLREMLALREVPEGYVGVAVHEKGRLMAIHRFPAADLAEGRVIPAAAVVSKMKGILKGDPVSDPRAFHYLRHAGLNRLRARQYAGWGFLLWTVVNDPQAGAAMREAVDRLRAKGTGALTLVATEGALSMAAADVFADLEAECPDLAALTDATTATVPLSYEAR